MWQTIEAAVSDAIGTNFKVRHAQSVSGGCINESYCLEEGTRRYFVKLNKPGSDDMFAAEVAGLRAIRESGAVLAPAPVCHGRDIERSWLVLEWLDLACPTVDSAARLGEQLAVLHQHRGECFGFARDNYIGSSAQPNNACEDWVEFLASQRLGFQLDLAADNGAPGCLIDSGQQLLSGLPAFFHSYTPEPSLLHGDLWGGNWGCTADGAPVIFDPAVYYGDREADLAMTELFGGFDERFYRSYQACWAPDPGYSTRRELYNLYHILNHYNLFGGGYCTQAQGMIERLLAELS